MNRVSEVIWRDLEAAAPDLAQLGRERFARTRVALLGSLRRDGSPRISPVEPHLVLGHLLFGLMGSAKVHDLLEDSRCVVHSSVSDVNGSEGEFKLYGRAVLVEDPQVRDGDYDAWWHSQPAEAAHVFSLDIESAAFIGWDVTAGTMNVLHWSPERGAERKYADLPLGAFSWAG
jgi:hypothetical protein